MTMMKSALKKRNVVTEFSISGWHQIDFGLVFIVIIPLVVNEVLWTLFFPRKRAGCCCGGFRKVNRVIVWFSSRDGWVGVDSASHEFRRPTKRARGKFRVETNACQVLYVCVCVCVCGA